MKKILFLFFILLAAPFAASYSGTQRTANFLLDYTKVFNTPPKYTIYDNKIIDMADSYYILLSNLTGSDIKTIPKLTINTTPYSSSQNCQLEHESIQKAAAQLKTYIKDTMTLPVALNIDDCILGNADFLYIIAEIISKKSNKITFSPRYYDEIIQWNAPITNRKIEYTLDFESDMPSFSKNYNQSMDYILENTQNIAVNPKNFGICVDDFCTLPNDYTNKEYSSTLVAWPTAIMKYNKIYKPQCYPFCGVKKATPFLIDFMDKYGIPLNWHMTGDSIIALADNKSLLDQILEINKAGLLTLGIQTMYHSNIKAISEKELDESIRQNIEVFQYFFRKNATQFRAPYQQLKDNYSTVFLEKYNIMADNEPYYACRNCRNGNYEKYPDSDVLFLKIDTEYSENDDLFNFFPYHPWEFIYKEKGNPTYLIESNEKKEEIIAQWLFFIGELGLRPISAENYLENER